MNAPYSVYSSVTSLWDEAEDFAKFSKTSSSTYKDWAIASLDTGGTGFYKEAGGYGNAQYHLTSLSTIIPTANTRLRLSAKYHLASDVFRVLVSTDRNPRLSPCRWTPPNWRQVAPRTGG